MTIGEYKTIEKFQEIEANTKGVIRWSGSKKPFKPILINGIYKIIYTNPGERRKTMLAHGYIATLFVPNPKNYKSVRALDGDYTNLRASNLEWVKNAKLMN